MAHGPTRRNYSYPLGSHVQLHSNPSTPAPILWPGLITQHTHKPHQANLHPSKCQTPPSSSVFDGERGTATSKCLRAVDFYGPSLYSMPVQAGYLPYWYHLSLVSTASLLTPRRGSSRALASSLITRDLAVWSVSYRIESGKTPSAVRATVRSFYSLSMHSPRSARCHRVTRAAQFDSLLTTPHQPCASQTPKYRRGSTRPAHAAAGRSRCSSWPSREWTRGS